MIDEFSAQVRQFIDQHIESIAQIEALLLLRENPQRGWTSEEMAKALYIPPEMAKALLANFSSRGFVKLVSPAGVQYNYHVGNAELDDLIGQAVAAYRDRRVAVISLIYSKPTNKVQTFADAFRLRKENPQ